MKNKKRKLNAQTIFIWGSIVFLLFIVSYFGFRFFYYYKEEHKVIDSKLLKDIIINSIDTYSINNNIELVNNEYRYTGNPTNNYVKYKGYLWRIIKINEDNSITMITDDTIISLSYNNIYEWLNPNDTKYTGIFLNTLDKDDLNTNKTCIDTFDNINDAGCFEFNNDYMIGQLSVDTYLNAGGLNSYLNNGTNYWASNTSNNNKSWYITKDGKITTDEKIAKHGIRPVITIKENIEVVKGVGTYENPYIIEDRTIKTLKDSYVGEYLNYNNTKWRIVSTDTDKIKIASTEYIKNNDKELSIAFDSTNNIISSKTDLINYLNTTYYKTLDNKEYLTKGKYYTGAYSLIDNNYKRVFDNNITAYVGVLSLSEPFAYELSDTYLLTPSTSNDLTIYTVNNNKSLYENSITSLNKIRPVLYLKNNITITKGNGSNTNPYILGGITNEI